MNGAVCLLFRDVYIFMCCSFGEHKCECKAGARAGGLLRPVGNNYSMSVGVIGQSDLGGVIRNYLTYRAFHFI